MQTNKLSVEQVQITAENSEIIEYGSTENTQQQEQRN